MAPATRAIDAPRRAFIRRTYFTLAGAILAFAGVMALLLNISGIHQIAQTMINGWNWLLVMGAFTIVAVGADKLARSNAGTGVQLAGLGLFVVIEAVIFIPLMVAATSFGDPGVIKTAGLVTIATVCGLSTFTFMTGADFSWLLGILVVGFFVASGLIVASILFGFSLGVLFMGAMVLLAASALLYQTSAMMYQWNTDQHIAAALGLFSSVMLMFYYILMILMSRD
ncbi:MAG: Bax inhibitor-1 family protein [Phycisphaerales bacterium]|nr:Bax inhibitor-1 family protein [Phycisphaerales bacterium]